MSRWTALRAVMRDTPNSSHSIASEGSGSSRLELGDAGAQRLLDLVVARDEPAGARCSRARARRSCRTASASSAHRGAVQRRAAQAEVQQRQVPAAEVRAHHAVEPRPDEADVGRRAEQRPLRILGDDLEVPGARRGGRCGPAGSRRSARRRRR